jgi:hypothetical protein
VADLPRIVQGVKQRRVPIEHDGIGVLQPLKYESTFNGLSGKRTGDCGAATAASTQPEWV